MNEKEIKKLFRQTGDSLQAIFDYFRLKNKVLWTGSEWTTGSKTVKDIGKYKTIKVYPWNGWGGVLLERISDTKFNGGSIIARVSSADSYHTSVVIELSVNGDTVSIPYRIYMHHVGGGGTHSHAAVAIVKIVGVEPILPAALQNIIGGGYCIIEEGGVWHETIHHLKAYYTGYNVYKNKLIRKGKQLLLHYWLCVRNKVCDIYSMYINNTKNGNISRTWRYKWQCRRSEYGYTCKTRISRYHKSSGDRKCIWSIDNGRRWRSTRMGASRCESNKCKDSFNKLRLSYGCMDGERQITGNTLSLATRGCVS